MQQRGKIEIVVLILYDLFRRREFERDMKVKLSLRAEPSVRENKQLQERQTDVPLPGPHTQLIIFFLFFFQHFKQFATEKYSVSTKVVGAELGAAAQQSSS